MSKQASYLCDTVGNTVTVYVRGEIDHHTAVSIRNGIDGMLFEKRPEKLILDLSGVSFMDSSGLGLIMGRLSVMKSLGGDMILQNPGRETDVMLGLSGMERLLRIERREENAERLPEHSKKTYVPPRVGKMRGAAQAATDMDISAVGENSEIRKRSGKRRASVPKTVVQRKEEMA